MCGICGAMETGGRPMERTLAYVGAMADALYHRGPDAGGAWSDDTGRVGLGHRRLSIIDLSPTGAQPMTSADARWTIVFNGEIYNFRELRDDLAAKGHSFRGTSDTEVILAAFSSWGVQRSLERFNGMFALAAWDNVRHELTLARDRIGEKPLYYGWSNGTFLFGSELKSLAVHPAVATSIDRSALGLYLRHGYIPAPYSIQKGIRKLPAGTRLTVGYDTAPEAAVPEQYWQLSTSVRAAASRFQDAGDAETIDEIESLIADAVALRMIADVPLGAFLSGGIDSSTVVALMQRASSRPVRTFSIGFAERTHDEAPFARAVAEHLGTDHTELRVTPAMALDLIPRIAAIYDEPFGDSSAVPTTLLAQLTRAHVTVALSGDGGDELFGGYTRYARAERAWRNRSRVPAPARLLAATALRGASRAGPRGTVGRTRLDRFARLLASRHPVEQYGAMTTYWDPATLLPGATPYATFASDASQWQEFEDSTQSLMYVDAMMYLPDDILVKVDRASMSTSLEARVPLLDHRLVERAWALPRRMRVRGNTRKWILREILARHVPRELFERPKAGFGVPLASWLRGPLREWADALLAPARLQTHLNADPIRACWRQHLAGSNDHTDHLWIVLMFQAWLESQAAPAGARS